jgi:uncharacterized membrane protein (UPF0127 family)
MFLGGRVPRPPSERRKKQTMKRTAWSLAALTPALLLGLPAACNRGEEGSLPVPARSPADPGAPADPPAPDVGLPTVMVTDTQGNAIRVSVEVVRTPQDRARGLMFRRELKANHGMLFLFDREEIQSFWMRNTFIPLDMLFIDRDGFVVGIVQNAEPQTNTSRTVGIPSQYVLEVTGGWSKKNHVGPGSRVDLGGIDL